MDETTETTTEPTAEATTAETPVSSLTSTPPAQGAEQLAPAPQQDQAKPNDGKPEAVVPDKYDPFLLPEGVTADAELSESFEAVAREIGLPQDKAQKLVDFHITQQQRQLEALNESWIAAVKSDPDIGGAKLDANLAIAAKAVDAFGGDDLRRFFDETGMGNHPAMVRLMVNIGRRVSEDSFVPGGAAGETKSAAEILYPKHT